MTVGAGATVALLAAAKEQRRQEVMDGFRLADATSPDRARRIEEIGIANYAEAEELLAQGVLVAGRREGTFWLSEPGYIAYRQRNASKGKVVALVIVSMVLLILGLVLVVRLASQ
ncbi:MAG TPA: hypothetical protein VFO55_01425 [Gemmatimonadaceae bacterium]|nr:hypothetical protein [Gemmatimonadaceae bacterium]